MPRPNFMKPLVSMITVSILALAAMVLTPSHAFAWDAQQFKKPTDTELKKRLTPLQYKVTQKDGTEPAFDNPLVNEKRDGIYVDIVSGEPLFSSRDKFDSGTGWPSFVRPLKPENIVTKSDRTLLFAERTEVRSKHADSHLGHVFDDGPKPTGLRYCMNSAALRFVPATELEKQGYGEFAGLFGPSGGETALATATFAGGCFWCMEPPFEKLKGVKSVVSGYTGGTDETPTYKEVSAGGTGHIEAVLVSYDPGAVTYTDLLQVFWRQIDPTDAAGQFVDRGQQYGAAVFYANEEQKRLAETSKETLNKSNRFKKPITTEIRPVAKFYPAEEYHQDYYKKNPVRYKYYRYSSGRDQFLDKHWGKEREIPRLVGEPSK